MSPSLARALINHLSSEPFRSRAMTEERDALIRRIEEEALPHPDGPYRPALADAFRDGARELQIDRLHVEPDARVEESEGGAIVHCTVFVSDSERLPLPGEDGEAECPHCGEAYSMNWVASVQPCPHCNGLIEARREAA